MGDLTTSRMTRVHDLKIDRSVWTATVLRHKSFEIRKNDRDFKEKDDLLLRVYARSGSELGYTREWSLCHVDYILADTQYGMQDGYVIMSVRQMMYGHNDEWQSYPNVKNFILAV